MKVYQRIALLSKSARANTSDNLMKAWDFLNEIDLVVSSHLPEGTQFYSEYSNDSKMVFKLDVRHEEKLLANSGWTYHKIVVTPSWTGFDLTISGSNMNGILERLKDTFTDALDREFGPVPKRELATA